MKIHKHKDGAALILSAKEVLALITVINTSTVPVTVTKQDINMVAQIAESLERVCQ